jgi:hypothetical protein
MATEDDRRIDGEIDDYLWDPSAPPASSVQSVERRLAPARFDAVRRPLKLPEDAARRPRRVQRRLLALAAGLVLIAGATAFWSWRWSWPAGAPWPATIQYAAPGSGKTSARVELDQRFEVPPDASARVQIARIGSMAVAPGSALVLSETRSDRHRVQLDRGAVRVRVWAPPGRFAFQTPAGSVIDLGCIFDLSVDASGVTRVRVDTGWVQLANGWGESLVPAGASSTMAAASSPGVPIYEDAAPAFAAAVRAFERTSDAETRVLAIDAIVDSARPRDVLSLLVLARVAPESAKRRLLERAARLSPPPTGVSVDAIVGGDNTQLWRWYDALDLPPVKSWWLNWRDAFPRPAERAR